MKFGSTEKIVSALSLGIMILVTQANAEIALSNGFVCTAEFGEDSGLYAIDVEPATRRPELDAQIFAFGDGVIRKVGHVKLRNKKTTFDLPERETKIKGNLFESKDGKVILKVSDTSVGSSRIHDGIAKVTEVSRLEYSMSCIENERVIPPAVGQTMTSVDCVGKLTSSIRLQVTGQVNRIPRLNSSVDVTGNLNLRYQTSKGNALPPNFIPLKAVAMKGVYTDQSAINGGRYLTITPIDKTQVVLQKFYQSTVFEPGQGDKTSTTIEFLNPDTSKVVSIELSCKL